MANEILAAALRKKMRYISHQDLNLKREVEDPARAGGIVFESPAPTKCLPTGARIWGFEPR